MPELIPYVHTHVNVCYTNKSVWFYVLAIQKKQGLSLNIAISMNHQYSPFDTISIHNLEYPYN
jgi:hypothetical protein